MLAISMPDSSYSVRSVGLAAIVLLAVIVTRPSSGLTAEAKPRRPILSDTEAWKRLPTASKGEGMQLPHWARMLAADLPRTTAALLQLDRAQRERSPVAAELSAAMRWISAHANQCHYAMEVAAADARRAGVDKARLDGLGKEGFPGWTREERAALEFARKMTTNSDAVTDAEFARLVASFGDRQAASMVLMMAYANFQDRLLLCLNVPLEPNGPLPAAAVEFAPQTFVAKTTPPPPTKKTPLAAPTGKDDVASEPDWSQVSFETLQERLEAQRQRPTRLKIPTWEEVSKNLPAGLFAGSSDIVWYRIVFGYAPELAVPFEYFMRTAGAEAGPRWDRIFGQGLFWVTTRAINCPYCMGHCEMNWEVAGLTRDEIAERSRLLAGNDWSSFPAAEQHAYAFARKLTVTPWKISDAEVVELERDFGSERALLVMLNASRYHYMTRISNGFQLTLERENVFYDYYKVDRREGAAVRNSAVPVKILSDAECWEKLPKVARGEGRPLPVWARAVAVQLPRTAAAMLQLDFAQRTRSPLDPQLRAKMRWVVAHANRSPYGEAYALADFARAGASRGPIASLTREPARWPEADRDPLEFAQLLTVAAPLIPDELFERLRQRFGDQQVAAMVLLAAYGNFQDRLLLGLNLPIEPEGPLPPVEVEFAEGMLQLAPIYPPQEQTASTPEGGKTVVTVDPEWSSISYDELQTRLERQRNRKPRLPIPAWEEVKKNVPPEMAARPTRIVWNLVCSGYVPELAVPWSIATRTMWAETKPDRVLEESLFWIQTRSIGCNYCMGHCEMLLEVAGLNKEQIAERTRLLAGNDWSAFPPAEQRAYAYARKLSRTPWELTADDYRLLENDYGPQTAMATFWWLCRGLYMTRVSDGFQLPLERENVFALPKSAPTEEKK